MIFQVALLIAFSVHADEDALRARTSEQLLEYSMGRETTQRGSFVTTTKDVNFVASNRERQKWLKFIGRTLSDKEREVVRVMVKASECHYVNHEDLPRLEPPQSRVNLACKSGPSRSRTMCYALIKCTMPGLTYKIGGICLADERGQCPKAQDCAVGAELDFKDDNQLNDSPTFKSMWVGGYGVQTK